MAMTRPLLATSLLLCSLLVIASADDYSYDSSKNQAYGYGTNPEGEDKPDYDTKPTPKGEEKPDYGTKPFNQPQPEKPDYDTKKNFYKPQPEEKENPKSEEEEKSDYGTKPDFYKPQPGDNEKPETVQTEKPDYSRKPVYQPQSEKEEKTESKEVEKPDYGTKPDFYKPHPEDKEKPEPVEKERPDSTKPVYQPQPEKEEKPDYDTTKNFYKSQPEENEKPESDEEQKPYGTKPDFYKPQPEEIKTPKSSEEAEKPNYSTKPDFYKPKSEEKEKSSYDRKPYVAKPNPEGDEKPDHYGTELPDFYPPKPKILPIGVQGLVLCKAGSKYYPIQGALARITCLSVDENGYEKPHSVCSGETDAKGYFFATLSPLGLDDNDQLTKLTDCKAFLESSPLEKCNVPVDVNNGISGSLLSDFRVLEHKRVKLYSVGPFFFSSEPNSVPNGY